MRLEVNKIYSGFVVKHAEYVDEIQSDAYLLEHEKSGARLLYLANSDDNKVFSISFRTPPYDDTGASARRRTTIPAWRIFWNILRCVVRANII